MIRGDANMIRWKIAAILATTLALSAPANAASLLEACEADIATHCADVTPGDGRLSACLYAYEDKLSPKCDQASGELSDVMDQFFERVREVAIACGEDVQKHCSDVEIGEGRMMKCLAAKQSDLAPECTTALGGMSLPKE